MKVLENRTTELKNPAKPGEEATNTRYSDLVESAINGNIPQGGLSPAEMRKRLRIMKVVKAAVAENKSLMVFEDDDANNLKNIIKQSRWGMMHEDLVQFADDVENMRKPTQDSKSDEEAKTE